MGGRPDTLPQPVVIFPAEDWYSFNRPQRDEGLSEPRERALEQIINSARPVIEPRTFGLASQRLDHYTSALCSHHIVLQEFTQWHICQLTDNKPQARCLLMCSQKFSRDQTFRQFCLSHLFTFTAFDNGVLGLAYIGSSRPYSPGGICSPGNPFVYILVFIFF